MHDLLQRRLRSKKGSGSTRLSVEHSDISEEETDVIVNTTTAEMKLSDTAVSKALLRKAGNPLQQTCDQLVQSGLKLDHGQIVETKSCGNLLCKHLIHAYLPPLSEANKSGLDHHALIVEIVTKCLNKAEEMEMKSISFPAFGLGKGGYSVTEVAEPMLTAFRDFGRQGPSSLEIIRVVIFDAALHQEFHDFFAGFFKADVSTTRKFVSGIYNMLTGHMRGGKSVELQDGSRSSSSSSTAPLRYHHTEPIDTNELLVFNIFAASDDKCKQIEAQVREVIEEKCKTDSIENPVIKNLIDADIEEIRNIGDCFHVQVSVLTQLGKVEIKGVKGQVKDAHIEIMRIMREIEKAEMELKQFQWQSENDSEVEKYSDEDSFKLERAMAKNLHAIEIVIDYLDFIIDLDRMEERNKTTGDVRKVARVPIKKCELVQHDFLVQPFTEFE